MYNAAIVLAIVALVVAAIYFFRTSEGFTDGKTTVTLYSMNGCPHCVAFQPEWTKFTGSLPNGVTAEQIDANDPRTQKAGVQGFPTIIVAKNGTNNTYSGDRTAAALLSYVNSL
jgi:glutaredoxin